MSHINELLNEISTKQKKHHENQGVILTFQEYLDSFALSPRSHIRDSATYIKEMFQFFGTRETDNNSIADIRFKLFDLGTEAGDPIIGGENVQMDIFNTLTYFQRQGAASKLIVLHGPNGSSKSSTIDAISHAMQNYSRTQEGVVYRFNWIFPTDKTATPTAAGESGPIGFGKESAYHDNGKISYARTDESKISSKIISEYKENPIYLIPMPHREEVIREAISKSEGIDKNDVEIPPHILKNGLSKRNQQIFENLLNAYQGDIVKVFRHVQIERFYYSKQYRVGISTVEPQLRVDAAEKQLTMDKNISNIPSVLQTISFFEAQGELIEANRGMLEFSDFLKRPVEAFKYLLTTIEKGSVNLPSSSPQLDVTFIASTNEKHLDAFKQLPDFSSFKGRMEFVTVPYLLEVNEEQKIYRKDIDSLIKNIDIAPHAISTLCTWAIMTRLKQPDTEHYPKEHRVLISKLDPLTKVKIYDGQPIPDTFKTDQRNFLDHNRKKLLNESRGLVVYEGKFGASPREVRGILHRAAQSCKNKTLTVLDIFNELKEITKDKTLYEFLQFEPRAGYHDAVGFIKILEKDYAKIFEGELLESMAMVDSTEYDKLLKRYIDHAVAQIKNEKILDSSTGQYQPFSEQILKDVEKILDIKAGATNFRKDLLARLAAWKIDNPNKELVISEVFDDLLSRIKTHFFKEKEKHVKSTCEAMLKYSGPQENDLTTEQKALAESTFENLKKNHGYSNETALEALKFLMQFKNTK
jgi:predicted Ser/Thr protein kinase